MSGNLDKESSTEKLAPVELANKYDGTQLKNATDDEIARFYGKEQKFTQSFKHTDIKLFLGYFSCLIAGGSFLYEYKTNFNHALEVTKICVVVFWILQGINVAYIYLVEKNEIFRGTLSLEGKPSATLIVSGKIKKFSSSYPLTLTYTDISLNKTSTLQIEPNVATWFTDKGVLDRQVANRDLLSYVERLQKMLHKE
ncbi:signal peptidase complex subunit 2 [Sporodiniella umbellata]|nr:signal peptidase complex subunit 2 [Sporodiniella umbellata]